MNLGSIWEELTPREKCKLVNYLNAIRKDTTTMATLPFINCRDAWMATPVNDHELLAKLRPSYWKGIEQEVSRLMKNGR